MESFISFMQEIKKNNVRDALDKAVSSGSLHCVVGLVASKDEILFEHAAGFRDEKKISLMYVDSILAIASCTKLITSIAALQLVEAGIITLDDPVSKYLPRLEDLKILNSFNGQELCLVPTKETPTIRQLMTHTSGYVYPFWNKDFFEADQNKAIKNLYAQDGCFEIPIAFEPGSRWAYGIGLDILGEVIKEVSQMSLYEYFSENIFQPLEMNDTAYQLSEEGYKRSVTMMQRLDNSFIASKAFQPSIDSSYVKELGGEGLYSTAVDFSHVLQMLLNQGSYKGHKILSDSMIDLMFSNQTGNLEIVDSISQIPSLTKDFNLSFGSKSHWGLGITYHPEGTQYGRSKDSASGAGIFNTYYWVDRQAGHCGFFSTQLVPFFDDKVIEAYQEFESSIYS